MSFDGDEKRWMCGRSATVNLQLVSSIVREIRDPCLHRSPTKGSKMLKPEKWQSIFDNDGKASGFQRALKLIILGGVNPSIRPEVWEFLLGCYALGSTTEHRKQLRMARRERYEDLVRECQTMHSSIGTGTLAYAVGSKVMDVRTLSKDNASREEEIRCSGRHIDSGDKKEPDSNVNNGTDTYPPLRESSCDSPDLVGVRETADSATCDPSYAVRSSEAYNVFSIESVREAEESHFPVESFFDFPPLPVTNLFQKANQDEEECETHSRQSSLEHTSREAMHSFQINNNVDLIIESNDLPSADVLPTRNSETETFDPDIQRHVKGQKSWEYQGATVNRLRISDVPEAATMATSLSNGLIASEDRVSEWLWTLHRIVVDVVRTDSHLEFYGDSRNMARMSDILAVYAWVDPATGYCQGMSDLLSPFVVLYEDNADAFWCFEMLLRRMRENFQMEGPTGVMKQLQALWKIVELTDAEIFTHLSLIGAESLHFAFRMLLVLFRRELSFNEALCMWEMMWAADFDEAIARELEENCLEPLVLKLPRDSDTETMTDSTENGKKNLKTVHSEHSNDETTASHNNGVKSDSRHPFCGLTKASFWARQHQLQIGTIAASTRGGDELPVFCVAAILIINRQRIMRKTRSIDDVIKMFNDNLLKINVKRCIRMAIKLRKKYFYKLTKHTNVGGADQ